MQAKGIIQATLLFTSSLTIMANATMAPTLPVIKAAFHSNPYSELLTKFILTLPALMIVLGSPFAGWVIDRTGRKRVLIIAVIVFGVAGSMGAFLNSLPAILVSRAFLGLAVAITMTVSTTLIGDYFTGDERSGLMSKQGAFMALGGVLYISLAGFLSDIHWRYPFLIYLMAFLALPSVIRFFYEPVSQERRGTYRSLTPEKEKSPGVVKVIYITVFLGMAFFYFIPIQLPFLIRQTSEVSNSATGLAISSAMITGSVLSFMYYRIKRIIPRFQTIFAVTFTALTIGYYIIYMAESYSLILVGLVFSGVGMGLLLPNTNLWIVSVAPEAKRGRLIGGITTAVFLGQFVSPLVSEPLKELISLNGIYGAASGLLLIIALSYWTESVWFYYKEKAVQKPGD